MSITNSKSIFDNPFYRSLLCRGVIPGEADIPRDLLEAMSILIGRSMGGYIDPTECRGPAALVVLALGESGWVVSPPKTVLQSLHTSTSFLYERNNPLETEEAERLHSIE